MSNKVYSLLFLSFIIFGTFIYGQEKNSIQISQSRSKDNQYLGAGKDFVPKAELFKPQSTQISGYKIIGNYTTYSYIFADLGATFLGMFTLPFYLGNIYGGINAIKLKQANWR